LLRILEHLLYDYLRTKHNVDTAIRNQPELADSVSALSQKATGRREFRLSQVPKI